jgi:hypothetical protein
MDFQEIEVFGISLLYFWYLLFTIQCQLRKIFGFRIIGGYMDKNSWIAESEALDELIAQKGCRTFQFYPDFIQILSR